MSQFTIVGGTNLPSVFVKLDGKVVTGITKLVVELDGHEGTKAQVHFHSAKDRALFTTALEPASLKIDIEDLPVKITTLWNKKKG